MSSWLNRHEIDELCDRYQNDPVLGPAARYLADYRDLIDRISDGWCYWAFGVNPAGSLSTVLKEADWYHRGARHLLPQEYELPTMETLAWVIAPIVHFVQTEPQMRGQVAPVLGGTPMGGETPPEYQVRQRLIYEVWHAQTGAFKEDAEDHLLVARIFLEAPGESLSQGSRDLAEVFLRTNHIDHSWTENAGVELLTDTARSTSVGDCIRTPQGDVYRVMVVGFRREPELVPVLRSTRHFNPQKGWSDAPPSPPDPA